MNNDLKSNLLNIEWTNVRPDEHDLQDGAPHPYPVDPVHPVHKFKQRDYTFGDGYYFASIN